MNLFLLAFACSTFQPPGGGEPKGCATEFELDGGFSAALGLSSHLNWTDDSWSTARRDFETRKWKELGVGHVRRDLLWRDLEPAPGEWNLGLMDTLLAATEAQGAELLALMNYGNPWANEQPDDHFRPPDDLSLFGDYAATIAQQYGDRIQKYEIWNEPNAGLAFWRPQEDPTEYGELLIEAADRIHANDPDALVSFAGVFVPNLILNTGGLDFIREVHAAHPNVADHIDALAFHPYRYPFTAPELETETQDSIITTTCAVKDLAEELGNESLALWMTEMGWHTAPEALAAGVSETEQAAYLVRSTLISLSLGVEVYSWYTFLDSGDDPENQENMFGLYNWDEDPETAPEPTPKLSATAFSVLSQALQGHYRIEDLSIDLDLDAQTWAYRLTGDSAPVTAVWTTEHESNVLLPGTGSAEVLFTNGSRETIQARGGAFEVPAGPSPVFLVEDE